MRVVTTTPQDFHIHVKRTFDKEVPNWAQNAHEKIHNQTASLMIQGTPVGNPGLWQSKPPPGYVGGRARSNWQSSVLIPKSGEPNGPNASKYAGAGETETLNRQGIAGLKPYSRSFISNNTPYILVLNDGVHSKQAPLMWMETALDQVKAQFELGGK